MSLRLPIGASIGITVGFVISFIINTGGSWHPERQFYELSKLSRKINTARSMGFISGYSKESLRETVISFHEPRPDDPDFKLLRAQGDFKYLTEVGGDGFLLLSPGSDKIYSTFDDFRTVYLPLVPIE